MILGRTLPLLFLFILSSSTSLVIAAEEPLSLILDWALHKSWDLQPAPVVKFLKKRPQCRGFFEEKGYIDRAQIHAEVVRMCFLGQKSNQQRLPIPRNMVTMIAPSSPKGVPENGEIFLSCLRELFQETNISRANISSGWTDPKFEKNYGDEAKEWAKKTAAVIENQKQTFFTIAASNYPASIDDSFSWPQSSCRKGHGHLLCVSNLYLSKNRDKFILENAFGERSVHTFLFDSRGQLGPHDLNCLSGGTSNAAPFLNYILEQTKTCGEMDHQKNLISLKKRYGMIKPVESSREPNRTLFSIQAIDIAPIVEHIEKGIFCAEIKKGSPTQMGRSVGK